MKLSYDGHGINDQDLEHSPRLATLTQELKQDRDKADALGSLFEASPDLLEACYMALDLIKGEHGEGVITETLRKAINKATGRNV